MFNKTTLVIITVLVISSISFKVTLDIVKRDYALYKLESICVMKQVSMGIPRKEVTGCKER